MAIRKPWARVAPNPTPTPAGAGNLEEYSGAIHRIHAIHGDRLVPECKITVRVYADDQLVEAWQVDESGAPDYTQRPVSRYPDHLGEYTVTVQGKAALQILGLDSDPIAAPQGTPTNIRWSSLAQAYRHLHGLAEFAGAESV